MSRQFDIDNYISVNERVQKFWKDHPNGRILTKMLHLDSETIDQRMVVIMAEVYLDKTDDRPAASGLCKEREGGAGANKTAFLENCESGAVGRALANLGYLVDKARASKEEMEAVERRQIEHDEALAQLKKLAKVPALRKKIETQWEAAKENPVLAIRLANELTPQEADASAS